MTVSIVNDGRIRVEALSGGRWRLLESVTLDMGVKLPDLEDWADGRWKDLGIEPTDRGTTQLTVQAGLDTDFASIPVLAQIIVGDRRHWRLAALVHDQLYWLGAPRRESDRVFWLIARAGSERVGPIRGFLGYAGLRIGGWLAYRKHTQARERRKKKETLGDLS